MLRMPFGKFKGRLLADLPTHYLCWLTTIDLKPWLRDAAEDVLHTRDDAEVEEEPQRNQLPANAPEIVARWYREMSLRFHPDRGGSVEAMTAINVAAERLAKLLEVA